MSIPRSRSRLFQGLFFLAAVVWLVSPTLPAQTAGQLKALYSQSETVVSGTISEALPFTSGISAMWSVRMKVDAVLKRDPAPKGKVIRMQANLLPIPGAESWKPPTDGGASHFMANPTRTLFLRSTGRSSPSWEVIPTGIPSAGSQAPDHAAQISALRRLQVEAWPFK